MDLSKVVAEVSTAKARHGRKFDRNSSLLSELSGEISNVEQNWQMKKLVELVVRQSVKVMRPNNRVDALTSQLKVTSTTFNLKQLL